MSTGQLVTLAVIGLLFVAFAVYVFVIRPRKRRKLPPPRADRASTGRSRAQERDEEPDDEVEVDPDAELAKAQAKAAEAARGRQEREDAERKVKDAAERARRAEAQASKAGGTRGAAEATAARAHAEEAASRKADAEAEFRRRDADERRRRAEDERRRTEDEAVARRREDAERKRKSDEERKKKREEEERTAAEAQAKREAEEAQKRAAAEAERSQRELELAKKRERLRRLKEGLGKTRDEGFVGKLGGLFNKKALDDELLGDLEEIMLTADIGMKTAETLFERVKEGLSRKELTDPAAVFRCLHTEAARILDVGGAAPPIESVARPYVIMVIGVNGSGKTTTIGKLAAQYKAQGKSVVLGAGDTFRAAATEQLAVWAQRSDTPVVRGAEGADPSSVLFNALQEAKRLDVDVVIADTAGRLQTKIPLMEELKKIHRVLAKGSPGAPHEVLLVLDATNGQNAISQAKLFNEALKLSGIVMTKLDGTAKGGVILGIVDELKVPVRYIGIGESIEDLREFNSADFLDALFEIRDDAA